MFYVLAEVFAECIHEKKLFLNNQHVSYQELSDDNLVSKMLNADLCEHQNDLNVKILGSGKTLVATFGYIKAFEKKLKVIKRHVDGERHRCFLNLNRHMNDLPKDNRTDHQSLKKLFLNIIESVVEQFYTTFSKFRKLKKKNWEYQREGSTRKKGVPERREYQIERSTREK